MQVFDAAWVETTDQQAKQHEETLEHDLHQAKITQLKDNIRSVEFPLSAAGSLFLSISRSNAYCIDVPFLADDCQDSGRRSMMTKAIFAFLCMCSKPLFSVTKAFPEMLCAV